MIQLVPKENPKEYPKADPKWNPRGDPKRFMVQKKETLLL
jgi:hypothetical protein